jgi:hypothetical protein
MVVSLTQIVSFKVIEFGFSYANMRHGRKSATDCIPGIFPPVCPALSRL